MREWELILRFRRYIEKKSLSKPLIFSLYLFVIALLFFTIAYKNHLFLFLFVTAFSCILNYHTNIQTIRFNFDPEVFFSLLLTRVIGFKAALLMIALPTIFIDIYTARLDKDTFISLLLTLMINYIMSALPGMDFVVLGIILVTVKFIVGLVINELLDISPQEILFEHILGFITNILVFLSFGTYLIGLFG